MDLSVGTDFVWANRDSSLHALVCLTEKPEPIFS